MAARPPIQSSEAQPAGREDPVKHFSIVLLFPDHTLTDHLPSGDGLVAFGFISALARRGHRLHIVLQRTAIKIPLPPNVTLHRVAQASPRGIAARVRFIAQSRAVVRRLLHTENIDLVHQLNPVCNGMSAGMFGLPLPLILGTYVAKWPSADPARNGLFAKARFALATAWRTAVMRFQENQAAAFLVTTQAALSRFSSPGNAADRVYWLPHGIDTSAFAQLPARAAAEKTILFLANVTVKKGIFTLLNAFEIIRREIPDALLVVAGDGTSLEGVQRHVASMQSGAGVRIAGPVSRADVPQLMADAAVYCLPSFGEPYATTVIEAMACAKPVVVTDSGGLPDMISDEGGRRVQTGNADQLAAALVEILRSPSLRESMGAHNRAVVESHYDWSRVVERLEAIYRGVLAKADIGA